MLQDLLAKVGSTCIGYEVGPRLREPRSSGRTQPRAAHDGLAL